MDFRSFFAATAVVAFAATAHAALVDRGGGMVYDTTRNITWLADMNYARTSGYSGAGVAVRSGDVAAAVPEPGTLATLGLALGGLAPVRGLGARFLPARETQPN